MAILGKGANRSVRSSNYINGIPRTKCPRHFKFRTTFNSGKLIPLLCDEFIPAQTKSVNIGELVRSITPLGPTMDNSFLDIFCFFVPRRLLWDHWEEFIAGYNKEAWAQDVVYEVPKIKFKLPTTSPGDNAFIGSFLDYMPGAVDVCGLLKAYRDVVAVNEDTPGTYDQDDMDRLYGFNFIDACYPRAFVKIWNDWFRDESTQDEYELYTGDNDECAEDFAFDLLSPISLPNVSKYHNRFTSALPKPLKGPDVLIPAGNVQLPVGISPLISATTSSSLGVRVPSGTALTKDVFSSLKSDNGGVSGLINSPVVAVGSLQSAMGTIRQLRLATQTELLLARDARGGTRYVESLLSHFGVHNGDARLQRSEYLGSRQIPLNIVQVTNTSQADSNALGNVGGQSITKDNAHYFTYSATEHGILWIVGCVRPNLSYSSGVRKIYQRWTRFDHIWPEFRHIGDVPLMTKELDTYAYFDDPTNYNTDKQVFGYTPYGSELREGYNFNNGLFRSRATGSLSYLTYQETIEEAEPSLMGGYIVQTDKAIGGTLTSQAGPQFYALFDIYMEDTIPLDPTSDPGLMDHF